MAWISQTEFARKVGVSRETVRKLIASHGWEKDARGRIDEDPCVRLYCEDLRRKAAGHVSSTGKLDAIAEAVLEKRERRHRLAIQNAQSRKDLLPVQTVTWTWSRMVVNARSRLRAVVGKARRKLRLNAKQARALRELVDDALTEMAADGLPDGARERLESDLQAVGAAPPAEH